MMLFSNLWKHHRVDCAVGDEDYFIVTLEDPYEIIGFSYGRSSGDVDMFMGFEGKGWGA